MSAISDAFERWRAVEQQHAIKVMYRGVVVGEYFVDLFVEEMLLVDLKAAKALDEAYHARASTISRQPACGSACC